MNFSQASQLFLRHYAEHGNRQELQEAQSLLVQYLLPRFGDLPVGEVTPEELAVYAEQLRFRLQRDPDALVDREVEAVLRTARRVLSTITLPVPRALSLKVDPVPAEHVGALWAAMDLRWRLYGRLRLEAGLSHDEAANAHWLDFEEDLRTFQRGAFPARLIPGPLSTQLLYAEAMGGGAALFPDLVGADEAAFEAEAWRPALAALGLRERSVRAVPETFAVLALARGRALSDVAHALGVDEEFMEARYQQWIDAPDAPPTRRPVLQPL